MRCYSSGWERREHWCIDDFQRRLFSVFFLKHFQNENIWYSLSECENTRKFWGKEVAGSKHRVCWDALKKGIVALLDEREVVSVLRNLSLKKPSHSEGWNNCFEYCSLFQLQEITPLAKQFAENTFLTEHFLPTDSAPTRYSQSG